MKKKKHTREENINNIIKSLIFSNREVTHKSIRFSILKEILLSEKMNEIFNKHTNDFRKIIIYYKDNINQDKQLFSYDFYLEILDNIRIKRINTIIKSGNTTNLYIEQMRKSLIDDEIEKNWVDRGYTTLKLYNGVIEAKIEDKMQLDYQLKILELDAINNINTKEIIIDKTNLNDWIMNIKKYAYATYFKNPKVLRNIIDVGSNDKKSERCFVYYCLTDGKVHIIHRIKLK